MKYSQEVESLERSFYLIGKQKIPYCTIQERPANSNILQISRNFSAIAWQVTHCYLLLYKYFHSLLRKDVSYMDPIIQNENNELISIVAKYIFQK